jgi:hypothetical protein
MLAFGVSSLAAAGEAQEMRPLSEVIDSAAAPYPASRCAGFYQALMEWTGENRLDAETWASFDAARTNLILLAFALSLDNGMPGNDEQVLDVVVRDVRNIADLYLARFERNYAAGGEAFGADQSVREDMTLCRAIAESSMGALEQ